MKRLLKYRFWDSEYNLMSEPVVILDSIPFEFNLLFKTDDFDPGEREINQENLIPLQFTGLRDKNKKECYEGDLVKYADGIIHEVGFRNGSFITLNPYKSAPVSPRLLGNITLGHTDFEIVGDIYRNPELIKGEIS